MKSTERKSPTRAPRLCAIYSRNGYLLGRAPLAFLYSWQQAAFAVLPNGKRIVKGGGS